MANRRDLKKMIHYICNELITETLATSLYTPGVSQDTINDVMYAIIKVRTDIIARISHTEKGSVKLFYKKLREDFSKQAEEIVDQLVSLN